MPSIDYGPILQAEAFKANQLTPQQQNMALMTSLFRDIAMPMMQLNLQKDKLAFDQQNAVQSLQLQKDELAQRGALQTQQFALRREEMAANTALESLKIEAAAEGRRETYNNNFKILELERAKGNDLFRLQKEHDLDMKGLEIMQAEKLQAGEWAQLRYLKGIETEAKLAQIEATKQAGNTQLAAVYVEHNLTPLLGAYQAAASSNNASGMAAAMEQIESINGRISSLTKMDMPLPGQIIAPLKTKWDVPEERQSILSNPALVNNWLSATKRMTPADRKSMGVVRIERDLMNKFAYEPIDFFSTVSFPDGRYNAQGELVPHAKGAAMKGATSADMKFMLNSPNGPAEFEKVFSKVIAEAKTPAERKHREEVRDSLRAPSMSPREIENYLMQTGPAGEQYDSEAYLQDQLFPTSTRKTNRTALPFVPPAVADDFSYINPFSVAASRGVRAAGAYVAQNTQPRAEEPLSREPIPLAQYEQLSKTDNYAAERALQKLSPEAISEMLADRRAANKKAGRNDNYDRVITTLYQALPSEYKSRFK